MPELFKHFLPSILQTKRDYMMEPLDGDVNPEKDYIPFIINRALSFHFDCILQANELNKIPHLDKKLQYQFLLNIIRGWKRPFKPWLKNAKPEDIDLIKAHYGYSNEKAREVLKILTSDQLNAIKTIRKTGGVDNDNKSGKPRRGKTKRG